MLSSSSTAASASASRIVAATIAAAILVFVLVPISTDSSVVVGSSVVVVAGFTPPARIVSSSSTTKAIARTKTRRRRRRRVLSSFEYNKYGDFASSPPPTSAALLLAASNTVLPDGSKETKRQRDRNDADSPAVNKGGAKNESAVDVRQDGNDGDGRSSSSQQQRRQGFSSSSSVSVPTAFEFVARRAALCLLESDLRRDAIGKENAAIQASSATNWMDDASSLALKQAVDKLTLRLPSHLVDDTAATPRLSGEDRDAASAWIRWLKTVPGPAIVDLSPDFRSVVNGTTTATTGAGEPNPHLSDESLDRIGQSRTEFLSRLHCRLVALPSGAALRRPLSEPPASAVYGKLLYGGVTRSRLLPTSSKPSSSPPRRRAGQRTEVKPTARDDVPAWMMYGGPDRMYEAVDMGSCAILEVVLLPRGAGQVLDRPVSTASAGNNNDMYINGLGWDARKMFTYVDGLSPDEIEEEYGDGNYVLPLALAGKDRNDAFRSDFESRVGGLQPQIDAIARRVLDGRVIRPATDERPRTSSTASSDDALDETASNLAAAALEAEELALLGLTPVRGLLMYGPSGCGKTALAREISRALRARAPKIVAAPELLDRWVGGSEKMVRELFADAEAELAACSGDATKSALHVIVIDEIDAVFRKRSASAEDSGEATRSSVVNQILSKLDGVNAIPNVLLIGMTNRRELLDDALLRPGRLEVQVEIPLPNKEGRREILQIHFGALRRKGRLSRPLCCAIDGVRDVFQYGDGRRGSKRAAVRQAACNIVTSFPLWGESSPLSRHYDLAADYATGGFSGADIAGLVRCAGSIALSRARKDGTGVDGLTITLDDVKQGLVEVKR